MLIPNPKPDDYKQIINLILLTSPMEGKETIHLNVYKSTMDNLQACAKASGIRVTDLVRHAVNCMLINLQKESKQTI